ncbi:MAG: hypothetical protein ACXQT2_03430 [Methanotrichaceae archaeon]
MFSVFMIQAAVAEAGGTSGGPADETLDVIYEGTVTLDDSEFTWVDNDGGVHQVSNYTPHGALEAASTTGAFDYGGSWKEFKNTALVNWIDGYEYDNSVDPKMTWNYLLNGVYQNYFSDTTGVSNNQLSDGDYLEFYYGPDEETSEDAIAVVRIMVNPGSEGLSPGAPGGKSVGNIVEIELINLSEMDITGISKELPAVHIIKYGADGKTVVNETKVTYRWMEENLPLYGDGTAAYRFEGVDFSEGDHWDRNETYPGGFKIDRVVKGTSVRDLCELVGGMELGTEIELVASDGYETALGYENIYIEELTPEQRGRQGEAFLAWWATDQGYVPGYSNGMRLFFTASEEDHVFGLWDMHECTDKKYWHYYWNDNIRYPSCAGLSAKYVETIRVYSAPDADWSLSLEGAANDTITKSHFEQALACTMGGHAAEYTDGNGRTWEGMPLWLLCGWVDDDNPHSGGAYNDSMAVAGYNITIISRDGYQVTFDSRNITRNENYIVANSLNGVHIPSDDDSWPLRLVGANVSGSKNVKGIARIVLSR